MYMKCLGGLVVESHRFAFAPWSRERAVHSRWIGTDLNTITTISDFRLISWLKFYSYTIAIAVSLTSAIFACSLPNLYRPVLFSPRGHACGRTGPVLVIGNSALLRRLLLCALRDTRTSSQPLKLVTSRDSSNILFTVIVSGRRFTNVICFGK
ncbi:hypothetical protein IW261DRAFT_1026884 [Armillaria novae-zelandiae]|uniref:Uncharacterized protein n=1 Tax=Armillaria novae-zelandiae TaxID=153914 RepID=A0AA39UH37_9AGAR|nr:hypothetical protein IW261DRAFT_1026884 [Armillaria novae-zelandiae]